MANLSGPQTRREVLSRCKGDLSNIPRQSMKSRGYIRRDGTVSEDTHTYECSRCGIRFGLIKIVEENRPFQSETLSTKGNDDLREDTLTLSVSRDTIHDWPRWIAPFLVSKSLTNHEMTMVISFACPAEAEASGATLG